MHNLIKILFCLILIISCKDSNPISFSEEDCNYGVQCCLCYEFTKDNYADVNLPDNQDCIVGNVCLTRGNNGALYNAYIHSSYSDMLNSEDDVLIKWAEGTIDEALSGELPFYNGLSNEAGNFGQLVQLPDRSIVAYLVEHDIYINFDFISWTSGQQGGGFSYIRDIPSISDF